MLDIVKGWMQPAVLGFIAVLGFAALTYLAVVLGIGVDDYRRLVESVILVAIGAGAKTIITAANGKPPAP